MLKKEVQRGPAGSILIMDSITKVTPQDIGAIVVSASHGGASSGEFALEVPLKAVFFNDAGVGKDNAGIAALTMLRMIWVLPMFDSPCSSRHGIRSRAGVHSILLKRSRMALARA